jgi:hypothetical protein
MTLFKQWIKASGSRELHITANNLNSVTKKAIVQFVIRTWYSLWTTLATIYHSKEALVTIIKVENKFE